MIELLTKLLKDLKVLVSISAILNVALVALVLRTADDVRVTFGQNEIAVKTLTLPEHIEALFQKPAQRAQVRALLEEAHFFEISPDNPRAESIAAALINLADRQSGHVLVVQLRDMSRRLTGPFKGLERPAKIIAKKDPRALSQGIAQVCLGSGFEDMYLTIWGTGRAQGAVTVHAERQSDCLESKRDVVELHLDDWKTLFDGPDLAAERPVIVRLHPPRVELRVDAQGTHVSGLATPAN